MAVLRSLMFLLIIFSMGNAHEKKCPDGWTRHGLGCYKFFPSLVNWITAERTCQSVGGNLACVQSKLENDVMLNLLPSPDTRAWIGGHDGEQEGQWLWTDGSEFKYTNWCSGEPNNIHTENCLEINWTSNRCFNDIPCSMEMSYLCEREL